MGSRSTVYGQVQNGCLDSEDSPRVLWVSGAWDLSYAGNVPCLVHASLSRELIMVGFVGASSVGSSPGYERII